jgi:hypothetical protein
LRRALLLVFSVVFTGVVVLSNAAAAGSSNAHFNVVLSGAQERPGPGDPNGTGRAVITIRDDTICYQVQVRLVAPVTAAHIHEAPAGAPGDVVVPLVGTWRGSPNGAQVLRGCVTSDEADEIRGDPAEYYVNVHTGEFPAGAVRGQLG